MTASRCSARKRSCPHHGTVRQQLAALDAGVTEAGTLAARAYAKADRTEARFEAMFALLRPALALEVAGPEPAGPEGAAIYAFPGGTA